MGDVFHEMWAYETTDEEEELNPYDPFQNTGDIPVPAGVPQTLPQGGINPNQGGFRDPVYNPANVQPGPNADFGIFDLGAAYNAIPFQTEHEQRLEDGILTSTPFPYADVVQPVLGDVGEFIFSGPEAFGVGMENPGAQNIGRAAVSSLYPETWEQAAAQFGMAPLAGGPIEAFTGVPVDDFGRALVRGLMPEPSPFPGLSAGVPPMNPMGGENVFGPGSRGASPDDAAIFAAQNEAALNNPYPWGPATPAPPPAAYPSMPEGTMGEMFPDVVREQGLDPRSPAARMGAPLAYDPQFMGPPPGVGQNYPEIGPISTNELTADDIGRAWENSRRQEEILTGGGTGNQLPASPGGLASQPPPASNIDQLISEATAPPNAAPFPMTTDEAMATAERLNLPISRDALERGTPLTRQQEMDALRAGMDFDNALRSASTENTALEGFIEANRAGPPPPRGGGTPGGGRGEAARNQNVISKAYDTIVDLLYAPFGFDQSQWFRQLDMRTLNPLRAAETAQTLRASADALRSADAAKLHFDGLADRLSAINPNLKMNFADWKGDFLNRETMTSKTLNAVPGYEPLNRGFVTAINERRILGMEDFAKNHPKAKPAELQTYANYLERVTGRGAFGNADAAISKLGPLFTSLRFTASWPQRAANLMPYHKLADGSWQIGGSAWGEAVKDHAGFIGTGLITLALASQAGLEVNKNGEIVIGKQHIDIWGGGKQYVKAVLDVINGEKNGKPYPQWLELPNAENDFKYRGTVAEFLRNKGGPVLGAAAAGLKDSGAAKRLGIEKEVNFLRPDFWDRGVTGRSMGWADRVGQYVVPLWVQSVAKAVLREGETDPLRAGAIAGLGDFTGASVQTYTPFPGQALSDMRKGVLGPSGIEYRDLMPNEQASLNKALEGQFGEKYTKAAQESQARLDPAIRNYQTQRDQVYKDSNAQIQRILEGVQNGTYDFRSGRIAMQALDKDAGAKVNELRRDPAYQKAIDEFPDREKSVANKALDVYRAIPNQYKDANGKIDWNGVEAKRAEFLNAMSPALRERLEKEINTPSENDHPYIKMLKAENDMVGRYKSLPDAEELALRRANPFDDAKLVYMGYSAYPLTPQAATYLQALAPGYAVNVGRR